MSHPTEEELSICPRFLFKKLLLTCKILKEVLGLHRPLGQPEGVIMCRGAIMLKTAVSNSKCNINMKPVVAYHASDAEREKDSSDGTTYTGLGFPCSLTSESIQTSPSETEKHESPN